MRISDNKDEGAGHRAMGFPSPGKLKIELSFR